MLGFVWTRAKLHPFSGESVACPLCGSSHRQIVSRRDRYLNRLVTVMCDTCGLVFKDPMPTDEELAEYYRHTYRAHYHDGTYEPRPKSVLRARKWGAQRLAELSRWLPGRARILDVGAGGGEFVSIARAAGHEAEGIEPNEQFSAFARERLGAQVHTACWQSFEPGAGGRDDGQGGYDLITSHHVVEHLRDPVAALTRFAHWLKPDGLVHISVPNAACPNRSPTARFHFAHVIDFTPQTLEMAARRAGLERVGEAGTPTSLVFRRNPAASANWQNHPDHARQQMAFYRRHTLARHLVRPVGYQKFVRRMARFRAEARALQEPVV